MKVFQIGFNKCGTQSLTDFFSQNGYKSVHWGEGKWQEFFVENQSNNNLLCEGADDIVFWSDIRFVQRQFQIFAEQYPTSKFIYNIRSLDKWLDSRDRQYTKHPDAFLKAFGFVIENRLNRIDYWKSEWLYHQQVIKEYFVGDKANRLLTFNIETDTTQRIVDFLPELEFNNLNLPHSNKG
jgi:hypothetical protein